MCPFLDSEFQIWCAIKVCHVLCHSMWFCCKYFECKGDEKMESHPHLMGSFWTENTSANHRHHNEGTILVQAKLVFRATMAEWDHLW